MMTYTWLPAALAFIDEYGIPPEVVESAAARPTTIGLNEDSGRDGYLIKDHRRGDVTAIVGYRDDQPSILYVRIHTHLDFSRGTTDTAGSGSSNTPKTMRGVRARIVAEGFSIVAGGSHDRVESRDGDLICSLPTTPSERRSVANSWSDYRRARDRFITRRRIESGDLLREIS
jgi:hypothetical protein